MPSLLHRCECPRRAGAESDVPARAPSAPGRRRGRSGDHAFEFSFPRLLSTGTLALAVVSTAVLVLAGCATPGVQAPPAERATAAQVGLADDRQTTVVDAQWWHQFGDAQLDAVVAQALAGSPSLAAATARVAKAQAVVSATRGAADPQVSFDASVVRQRLTENGLYPPPYGGMVLNSGDADFKFFWDLDLWGRNRADLEAALGSARAAQADADVAAQQLATQVVRTYFTLARLGSQREVAQRTLEQREQLYTLTRQRVGAGLDTVVELRQSEGAMPETRAQIEALAEQIDLARHLLAALTAQGPQTYAALAPTLAQLHVSPQPPMLGADLLARRPEVAAALARVEAASHQVESQRTRFYPDISLSAFAGLSAINLQDLSNLNSRVWGFGPALHLPIFEGGQLRAQLKGKAADRDAAIAAYNQSVIDAVHEAADAASSAASVGRQRAEQERALESAVAGYDAARQRYAQGLSSQLTVLNAETQWLTQRRLEVDLRYRTLDVQAQLMKSLGGGWAQPAVATPATATTTAPANAAAREDNPKAHQS
jgi:NodT family efflux transporter outer membrane factor (OMF) lipoprotein